MKKIEAVRYVFPSWSDKRRTASEKTMIYAVWIHAQQTRTRTGVPFEGCARARPHETFMGDTATATPLKTACKKCTNSREGDIGTFKRFRGYVVFRLDFTWASLQTPLRCCVGFRYAFRRTSCIFIFLPFKRGHVKNIKMYFPRAQSFVRRSRTVAQGLKINSRTLFPRNESIFSPFVACKWRMKGSFSSCSGTLFFLEIYFLRTVCFS